MPGDWITDRQCRRYMERRRLGDTQVVAAARAGISERSARRLAAAAGLSSQRRKPRGRTRSDPLAGLWDEIIMPILEAVAGELDELWAEICEVLESLVKSTNTSASLKLSATSKVQIPKLNPNLNMA